MLTEANLMYSGFNLAPISQDVPQFVEELLTSSFANPAVVPAVNRFLQEMLALIAAELSNPDPILPSTMQLLNRLFYNDKQCTWYYEKYGYPEDRSLSSADFVLDGPFAKAPKGSSTAQVRMLTR